MIIYFVRHGETDANVRIENGQALATVDSPLNATGIIQAKQVAVELKDIPFDAIMSSPLQRAVETAKSINIYHRLPITQHDELEERRQNEYADLKTWHDLFDFDKNIQPEGGETVAAFFDTIYRFIDMLRRDYTGKTICIVAHGGVSHAFHAYINELPLAGNLRLFPMNNCEYRIYELSDIAT